MCGIFGIYDSNSSPSEELAVQVTNALQNRGPDEGGHWLKGAVGLVHARLSIIDLESGRQPLISKNQDVVLVCNGEIYDYKKHRKHLIEKGYQFQTHSDSEVILHMYEEYGFDLLHKVNGMFAFAIWDARKNIFFIARDRLGQKPMFYSFDSGRFAFASGVSALQNVPWISDELDYEAIHSYFEWNYLPTPKSIYKKISKLEPGHYCIFSPDKGLNQYQYWKADRRPVFQGSYVDACAELKELLGDSVRRRLVADVPVGVFLSGGVDSSIIAAKAKEYTDKVQTFSIGFEEKEYDETKFAELISTHLGTEHFTKVVDGSDFDRLNMLVDHLEEPFADSSVLPMSYLSEFTKQKVKVALSGDGADELFGGYYRYLFANYFKLFAKLPTGIRKIMSKGTAGIIGRDLPDKNRLSRLSRVVDVLGMNEEQAYKRIMTRFPQMDRVKYYGESLRGIRTQETGYEWEAADLYDLNHYLLDDILVKVDRSSMGFGLEVRSPFLDVNVIEFALSLPEKWKLSLTTRKLILRDSFKQSLPEQVFNRPKMGFGLPKGIWMRGIWKESIEDLLLDGEVIGRGLLSKNGVAKLWLDHQRGGRDRSYPLFTALMLELWLRKNK